MPRVCTICRHSDRESIDVALVTAPDSLRRLASRFSVTASALRRHRLNHLPATLLEARNEAQALHAGTLADHVRDLYVRSGAILRTAEAAGDARNALAAVRELRGIIELIARMADKDSTRVDAAVVRALIASMFDLIGEFVPRDRAPSAIDRLEALAQEHAAADHLGVLDRSIRHD